MQRNWRKAHLRWWTLGAIAILSVVLLINGCAPTQSSGQSSNQTMTVSTGANNKEEPKVGLAIGNKAPDFTISMGDGKTLKLSDLKGKPVFLNFWATWCPYCKYEMPDIEKVHKEHPEVQIIAVDVKESPMEVLSYMSTNKYTFPVGFDLKGDISSLYMATGLPTSYAIDANGIIRYQNPGALNYPQLKQWFSTLEQLAKG